jgi:hypothetical protein
MTSPGFLSFIIINGPWSHRRFTLMHDLRDQVANQKCCHSYMHLGLDLGTPNSVRSTNCSRGLAILWKCGTPASTQLHTAESIEHRRQRAVLEASSHDPRPWHQAPQARTGAWYRLCTWLAQASCMIWSNFVRQCYSSVWPGPRHIFSATSIHI